MMLQTINNNIDDMYRLKAHTTEPSKNMALVAQLTRYVSIHSVWHDDGSDLCVPGFMPIVSHRVVNEQ